MDTESFSVFGEFSWVFFNNTFIPLVGLRYFTDDRSQFHEDDGTRTTQNRATT